MALTSSAEPAAVLDPIERRTLMEIARTAIQAGVDGRRPAIRFENVSRALLVPRATFVTLEIEGELRGCIGTLEAFRPLAVDVSENSYSAAFDDPRFPPVSAFEVEHIELHISILSPPEPLEFTSESDLLRQVRPRTDGLILAERGCRATLLPSVWEQVPNAREFLAHLKLKAGLPADYWSDSMRVLRYTTSTVP